MPARLVHRAVVEPASEGNLRVTAFEPWDVAAPPSHVTALICDGGAHHYFHFMESLTWLAALQRRFLPGAALARIVFAWPWDNPAQNHVQRGVLAALHPGVEVADPGWAWPQTLEDVLVIDRARHGGGLNKFLEAALGIARPAVLEMGARARHAVGVGDPRPVSDATRLLQVSRPPPRCLTAPAEAALLRLLGGFGQVTSCDFAAVPWAQQVRLAASHDVMVGVHGNGLTNALWMRPGSLVLELFPDGARHYDYQLFAELADLAYVGFEREFVFPAFSRTGAPYGHHAPTNQPVTTIPEAALSRVLAAHAASRALR